MNQIIRAVKERDLDSIKLLIANGSDVNTKDDSSGEYTLLARAIRERAGIRIIKFLIANGADVNAKDSRSGCSPLIEALRYLHVDNYGDTVAWSGDLNIVKLLVSSGADVNARDNYGATPLLYAASTLNINIIKFLVSSGADVNAKDQGSTPLINIILYISPCKAKIAADIIEFLISEGIDIHAKARDFNEKTVNDFITGETAFEINSGRKAPSWVPKIRELLK